MLIRTLNWPWIGFHCILKIHLLFIVCISAYQKKLFVVYVMARVAYEKFHQNIQKVTPGSEILIELWFEFEIKGVLLNDLGCSFHAPLLCRNYEREAVVSTGAGSKTSNVDTSLI